MLILAGAALAAVIGCAGGDKQDPLATFIIGRGADSGSLDAAHVNDGESFKVAELIFDTLVTIRPRLDGNRAGAGALMDALRRQHDVDI